MNTEMLEFIKQSLQEEAPLMEESTEENVIDETIEKIASDLEKIAEDLSSKEEDNNTPPEEEKTAGEQDLIKETMINKLLGNEDLVKKLLTDKDSEGEE